MLFNSFTFMIFLPVVFLLYWFIFKRLKWQNLLILMASYVFYGWWDWRFLILIIITSASSFASGLLIKHYEGRRPLQRRIVRRFLKSTDAAMLQDARRLRRAALGRADYKTAAGVLRVVNAML